MTIDPMIAPIYRDADTTAAALEECAEIAAELRQQIDCLAIELDDEQREKRHLEKVVDKLTVEIQRLKSRDGHFLPMLEGIMKRALNAERETASHRRWRRWWEAQMAQKDQEIARLTEQARGMGDAALGNGSELLRFESYLNRLLGALLDEDDFVKEHGMEAAVQEALSRLVNDPVQPYADVSFADVLATAKRWVQGLSKEAY